MWDLLNSDYALIVVARRAAVDAGCFKVNVSHLGRTAQVLGRTLQLYVPNHTVQTLSLCEP